MRLGLINVGPAHGLGQASTWMVHPPGAQHRLWPLWSHSMFKPATSHSFLLCTGFISNYNFFSSSTCWLCWQTQTVGGFSRFLSELWAGLSNAKGLFSELEKLVTPCTLHPQGLLPSPFGFVPLVLHFLQQVAAQWFSLLPTLLLPSFQGMRAGQARIAFWTPLLLCKWLCLWIPLWLICKMGRPLLYTSVFSNEGELMFIRAS